MFCIRNQNATPDFAGTDTSDFTLTITAWDAEHLFGLMHQDGNLYQIEGVMTQDSFEFTRFAAVHCQEKQPFTRLYRFRGDFSTLNVEIFGEALRKRPKTRDSHEETIPVIRRLRFFEQESN